MTNICLECNFERELHPVVVLKNYIPSDKSMNYGELGLDSDGWYYISDRQFKFHFFCKEFKTEIQLKLF